MQQTAGGAFCCCLLTVAAGACQWAWHLYTSLRHCLYQQVRSPKFLSMAKS
jgi:hypothetical protein